MVVLVWDNLIQLMPRQTGMKVLSWRLSRERPMDRSQVTEAGMRALEHLLWAFVGPTGYSG